MFRTHPIKSRYYPLDPSQPGRFFFRSSNDEFKWKSPNGACMCARENLGGTFTGLFFGGGGRINTDREKSSTPFAFLYQTPHKKPGSQSYIKSIYPRPRVPPAFGTPARLHACEKILEDFFFQINSCRSLQRRIDREDT